MNKICHIFIKAASSLYEKLPLYSQFIIRDRILDDDIAIINQDAIAKLLKL